MCVCVAGCTCNYNRVCVASVCVTEIDLVINILSSICKSTDSLLLSCKFGSKDITRYLLDELHLDPNMSGKDSQTPLSLASDNDTIQLLLQHGAIADNAYKLHQKVLGKFFSNDPLENPVKMFVTGLGGGGKSTLIEAMQYEPTLLTPLKVVFIRPKEVEGVSQKTAGIVPKVFNSSIFGSVQFYEFNTKGMYTCNNITNSNVLVLIIMYNSPQ